MPPGTSASARSCCNVSQTPPEELKTAHGYAYGGAIIQDLGYYPHGSHFFTDLTHYCRTGDFVIAMLRDSQDLNGYSFAIGALAHYASDNNGHRLVPIRLYPFCIRSCGIYSGSCKAALRPRQLSRF